MSNINLGKNEINEKLFSLLREGVSPFHVVNHLEKELKEANFTELNMNSAWKLEKGKNYYINHHDSTLLAFHVGKEYGENSTFHMAAAHTDFPCLYIKPSPEINACGYAEINVEVYGGPILNTWLDRPLAIAGRVATKSNDAFKPNVSLFKSKDYILTLPNLAIHMNREVNKGVELNAQTDMLPILGMITEELNEKTFFMDYLAGELNVKAEDILDYELFIYNPEEPCYVGLNKDIISASRLDNLTSCQALVSGLIEAKDEKNIDLIACFNHEEIGSNTKQGADSMLLSHVLEKIKLSLGATPEEAVSGIYDGVLLSVDVAHAAHPNYLGKMDITSKPVLNKGFCIKEACAQSYATDCEAVGIVVSLAKDNDIPYQKFVNRSDLRGGGTLGSMASALTPVKTIDVGVPMLAMHSARECMGAEDEYALFSLVRAFFA